MGLHLVGEFLAGDVAERAALELAEHWASRSARGTWATKTSRLDAWEIPFRRSIAHCSNSSSLMSGRRRPRVKVEAVRVVGRLEGRVGELLLAVVDDIAPLGLVAVIVWSEHRVCVRVVVRSLLFAVRWF